MAADAAVLHEVCAYFDEKAPVLFFKLSPSGVILEANAHATALAGRPLAGEQFQNLIVNFTGELDISAFSEASGPERLFHIHTRSGLPQSFYFSFKPVSDYILVFGRLDTQEIEAMRKEVVSLNQELNNLMRQLHQKNAQLSRLNQEKNQFLGMAAHDLRKPIGLIIAYSEFLIEEAAGLLGKEHQGFLNTINSSCTFMKRLVDDFLDVSAIEAGRFDLDLQPTEIMDVLEQSLTLNHLQSVKKGISLEVQAQEDIPRAFLDASKIEQVITNLVSNAIEHTRPGTAVFIRLSCDNEAILFSVQDQGPGIAPEEMDKLFKPFEKTSAKKTGGEKSTGLGMLITRKIIESHGGRIWVDSPPGEGATVSFILPHQRR